MFIYNMSTLKKSTYIRVHGVLNMGSNIYDYKVVDEIYQTYFHFPFSSKKRFFRLWRCH